MTKKTQKSKKKARRLSAQQKKRAELKSLREQIAIKQAEIEQIKRRAQLIDTAVRRVGREYIAPEGTVRPDIDTALEYFRAN